MPNAPSGRSLTPEASRPSADISFELVSAWTLRFSGERSAGIRQRTSVPTTNLVGKPHGDSNAEMAEITPRRQTSFCCIERNFDSLSNAVCFSLQPAADQFVAFQPASEAFRSEHRELIPPVFPQLSPACKTGSAHNLSTLTRQSGQTSTRGMRHSCAHFKVESGRIA